MGIVLFMYISRVCVCMPLTCGSLGEYMKVLDSLEWELQVVAIHPLWVLNTELRSSVIPMSARCGPSTKYH